MVPGDHPDSHWVRWHGAYEDPSSMLSLRLAAVQASLRTALGEVGSGSGVRGGSGVEPIRVVSMCAGQGRDVIDVVATHPRGSSVSALLVELDPALVAFARERAAAADVADRVRVVEEDASQSRLYVDDVPADVVLVCGVFGNISAEDMQRTVEAMPGFCVPGGHVIWTRHRRPPDLTPVVRGWFADAGFTEVGFEAPDGAVLGVGHHRLDGPTAPFEPDQQLFRFVGDGWFPA